MTDVDRLTVSLRISGADLDPVAVTRLLGVSPSFAGKAGDRWSAGGREFTQRSGVWSMQLEGVTEERTLAAAIGELLQRLPGDPIVWRGLAATYRIELFCGVHLASGQSGLRLQPELLQALADRHIELDFGIYSVESGDVEI